MYNLSRGMRACLLIGLWLGSTSQLPADQSDISTQYGSAINTELADSPGTGILQSLIDRIDLGDEDEIPHPDTAFVLSAELDGDQVIHSYIQIYPNTYLYKDKFTFELVGGKGHSIGNIAMPEGDIKADEFLGRTEVYHEQVEISLPIISEAGSSESFILAYSYQGCVEDLVCYPPVSKYLQVNRGTGSIQTSDLSTDGNAAIDSATANSFEIPPVNAEASSFLQSEQAQPEPTQSEQGRYARILQDKGVLLVIFLFFLGGIGLTFTPCVFPMIPILSSIIAGQGASISTRAAFMMSLVYVLSMATTYAIVGAIVGYYGAEYNIQIWFQDPVILSIFAAIFVLLALSMFGFYEIQMPMAIRGRLAPVRNTQHGGTLTGVAVMGSLSAIIVGPCITAPLVGALIFISQTQDWRLGGLALFSLGLGMGVPLLMIGTSAGKLLPRAGFWMDKIKYVFGVALLAVAIWMLERFLPLNFIMLLIAALAIISSVYMGALESLSGDAAGWQKLNRGLALILFVLGLAYLVGAVAGSKDLLQPLKGVVGSQTAQENGIAFKRIKSQQDLAHELVNSRRSSQPVMLDFYAEWCVSCKVMENYAFTHPEVLDALRGVASLQADVTDNDKFDTQLMTSLGIYGPPAILFFGANGEEIRSRRVVGEMSGEEFAAHIIATLY